jgi:hypothetical protein
MLFSNVGTAAAVGPIDPEAQPTETVDTEPEPTFDLTDEETGEKSETESESEAGDEDEDKVEDETEDGSESKVEEETGAESESESEEETEDESESKVEEETEAESESKEDETEAESEPKEEEETEDESESRVEEETEAESESKSEEETGDESESKEEEETEAESESKSEEEAEDESESKEEEETEDESESKEEEETEDESESKAEDETEAESESKAEDEPEDESKSEAEDEAEDESESETEAGTEDETESGTNTDMDEGTESKPEGDPNGETSVDSEKSDVKPSLELTPSHKHSWSVDWDYDGSCHWHECDAKDCPVTDDRDKDGYGEHDYDNRGVCIDCGFDAMDGIAVVAEGAVPTYQEAYNDMINLKEKYPEGMTWTNFEPYGSRGDLGDAYTWKGGAIYGARSGVGCMAFAFILSDAAFGSLPARATKNFTFEDVKVGDILRVRGNSHSVIVLQKSAGGVTVAEANFNKSVHWGRAMSVADVEEADFVITRYPEGYIPSDSADADEVADEGTAGNLKWSLTKAGELTVSGNGAIPDYSSDSLAPWSELGVSTIVIEDGVTGIGDYAFYQSGALNVYIPDSVTSIGQSAFYGSALLAVTIPGSVETIGNSAFRNCANLTSASVSEGLEIIGDNAFRGCTALTHIDFPASITSVGAGAFMDCTEMVSVRFMPGGEVEIGDNLFSRCYKLMSVTLPLNADCISDGMFASCSLLPQLYIPASVQQIGGEYGVGIYESPFNSCGNLRVIYFGGSEAEWNRMMNPVLSASLQSIRVKVVYDAEFEDPFAPEPDDPGDFQPGDDEKNPGDTDDDEKDPSTPDDDEKNPGDTDDDEKDPSTPDDDEKNPGDTDDDEKDPSTPDDDEKNPGDTDDDEKDPSAPDDDEKNPGDTDDDEKDPSTPDDDEKNPGDTDDDEKDPPGSGDDNKPKPKPPTTNPGGIHNGLIVVGGSGGGSRGGSHSSVKKQSARGSRTTIKTEEDGTKITTTTDASGSVKMEVNLSASAVAAAEGSGGAVALPISAVTAASDVNSAWAITVHTEKDQVVNVAIPTVSPTAGTVAVVVNEDGSTQVVKGSVPTENSVVAPLSNGATVKIVDNSKNFSDVPQGAWFEEAVDFVSARDLFHDTTETTFAPDQPMTYAVMMTALAGFDGEETEGGATWYEKSGQWAAANGISDGADPNSGITCEQSLTMLWKYQGSPAAADASADQMSDTQKAMNWAVANGIISISENEPLDPQGQISRCQAAEIIMNFAKKVSLNSQQ